MTVENVNNFYFEITVFQLAFMKRQAAAAAAVEEAQKQKKTRKPKVTKKKKKKDPNEPQKYVNIYT